MIRKITFSLVAFSTFSFIGMEKLATIVYEKNAENTLAKSIISHTRESTSLEKARSLILLQGTAQKITIAREDALSSSTLKELLSDIAIDTLEKNEDGIPVVPMHEAINEHLYLIEPYFKLAREKNITTIKEKLSDNTSKELTDIINAFNFLDIASIRTAALEVLAARMAHKKNLYSCLEDADGSYNIPLPADMQNTLAHKMVAQLTNTKSHPLLRYVLFANNGIIPCKELSNDSSVRWPLCFNDHGTLLACASQDGFDNSIELWDTASKTCMQRLKGHSLPVNSLCFNADGTLLASGSWDSTVKVWNTLTGFCTYTFVIPFSLPRQYKPFQFYFKSNGKLLVAASYNDIIEVWDLKNEKLPPSFIRTTENIASLCFNANGKLLASRSCEGTIKLWHYKHGICLQTLEGHGHNEIKSIVSDLCFSPDDTILASSSYGKTIKLWNPKTGICLGTLNGHTDKVISISFNGEGTLLASASLDKTIKLWDPHTATLLHSSNADTHWAQAARLSKDGTHLASTSNGDNLKLWSIADPHLTTQLKPEQVALIAYSNACKQERVCPDLGKYPGIEKIPLPNKEKLLEAPRSCMIS